MTSYNLRKRTNPVIYSEEAASQLKLTDLAKVVRLPTGTTSVCFSAESVLSAKEILDDPSSSLEKVALHHEAPPMLDAPLHSLCIAYSIIKTFTV